jgi:hypothetical protein
MPEHNGCGEGGSGEEDLRIPVIARSDAPLVVQAAEQDLDPVTAFVAAPVPFDGYSQDFHAG